MELIGKIFKTQFLIYTKELPFHINNTFIMLLRKILVF